MKISNFIKSDPMQSTAKTVQEYLASLPKERRADMQAVRSVILKNLPKGYVENYGYGMIGYAVPLKLYPAGYHAKKGEPLPYAALASQKHFMALYSMAVYGDKKLLEWFQKAYKASGKKLDMGKSCIRFKKLDDVPLDVIGELIAKISVKDYIAFYERAIKQRA